MSSSGLDHSEGSTPSIACQALVQEKTPQEALDDAQEDINANIN